jgi:hypothetical protein
MYVDLASGKMHAGSIEEIVVGKQQVQFQVQCQAPLPAGKNNPFKPFPHFPVKMYLSKMSTEVDMVDPDSVTGHYVCFKFSDE